MEKNKIEFYKRWWFWIIIILSISIMVESTSLIITFAKVKKDSSEVNYSPHSNNELIHLSKQISTVLDNSNVFFSADGSLMLVEIRDLKNEYTEAKINDFFEILKNNEYCRKNIKAMTLIDYFSSTDSTLVIRHVYDLKTNKDIEVNETYIDYDTYKKFVESMNSR